MNDTDLALAVCNGYRPDIDKEIEKEYNTFSQNTPYQIHPNATTTSKMIDTKQITQQLEKLKTIEEYHTKALEELTLDNINLDKLNIQEDPQEQSSHQAQIQQLPK
ncbi:3900_t:CDS:2 [Ambispora gerdemannii]|uniref:3900_t:CDS:1 n=1 Tax=Ambispora gerdemannii TaxID=144530 RepID=A0A9N8VL03_9GLOM|nr:3900_t:CDS:2 [Ambispora gerdemannii]